jgi:hypothetical protein
VDKMLPQVKAWVGGEVPKIGYEPQAWRTIRWHNGPFSKSRFELSPGRMRRRERKWLVMTSGPGRKNHQGRPPGFLAEIRKPRMVWIPPSAPGQGHV